MLNDLAVAVHAFEPHLEAPQARDVLEHFLRVVVERAVVLAGVAQGERITSCECVFRSGVYWFLSREES